MDEQRFYSKQFPLLNVEGQKLLKNARVAVIGAGGLGCPVLTYLVAAGVGQVGIFDGDRIELSNLHRQTLYSIKDINKNKAVVAKEALEVKNPFVEIFACDVSIKPNNIGAHLESYDLLVDCSDNFSTKFLLHDYAFLYKKELILASIYQFDGMIQRFNFFQRNDLCLRCLYPQIPEADSFCNCEDSGILGASVGVLGAYQAQEVIRGLLRRPSIDHGVVKTINLSSMDKSHLKIQKNRNCPMCSGGRTHSNLIESDYRSELELTWDEVNVSKDIFIDLRGEQEGEDIALNRYWRIPNPSIESFKNSSGEAPRYIFMCQSGRRSLIKAKEFKEIGFQNTYSLKGGVGTIENFSIL